MNLLGKLSWSAIPFDQPIVMGATSLVIIAVLLILGWITVKGYWPYLWREWITSVDHKRIGVRCAGMSAAGAFLPDLLGAWHDHDLLHGHAVRDRPDEFRGPIATRRPRYGVSDVEFGGARVDCFGHPVDEHLAG